MPSALKARLAALERLTGRGWWSVAIFHQTPKGTRVFVNGQEVPVRDMAGLSESERAAAEKRQRGVATKLYIGLDPEMI
jgi:hypothetical protein